MYRVKIDVTLDVSRVMVLSFCRERLTVGFQDVFLSRVFPYKYPLFKHHT